MLRILVFLFCISTACWSALVKNGYDAGLGTGYRKDRMTQAISREGSLLYKESDSLKGVLLDAYFDARLWGVLFSNYVDAGWYVSGRTHDISQIGAAGYPSPRASFHESAGGFFADAETKIGLVFDYTKRRGGFQIIPQAGYSVYYQQLKRGANHPEMFAIPNTSALSCDLSHTRLQRRWQGPLVGGDLVYKLLRSWSFEGGYYYFFLNFRQEFEPFHRLIYPSAEFFIRSKSRADFSGVHGQSIHGKIAAQVAAAWKMNWRFDIIDFFTSKEKAHDSQKIQQVFPAPHFTSQKQTVLLRAGWHSFSSILEVEYFF